MNAIGSNHLARACLAARGHVARSARPYKAPDDHRTITLAVGDDVILRRNHRRLRQPGGSAIDVARSCRRSSVAQRHDWTCHRDQSPLSRQAASPAVFRLSRPDAGGVSDVGDEAMLCVEDVVGECGEFVGVVGDEQGR